MKNLSPNQSTRMDFITIKNNFDRKLFNTAMVRSEARKGTITKDQFKEITGRDY